MDQKLWLAVTYGFDDKSMKTNLLLSANEGYMADRIFQSMEFEITQKISLVMGKLRTLK